MKVVDKESFLEAVQKQTPILETADIIDDELFYLLTTRSRQTGTLLKKDIKLQLSNVSYLVWRTICSACGSDIEIKVSTRDLSSRVLPLDAAINHHRLDNREIVNRDYNVQISMREIMYLYHCEDSALCACCLHQKEKEMVQHVNDYIDGNKLEFWRTWLPEDERLRSLSKDKRPSHAKGAYNPFSFYVNCWSFDLNKKLVYIDDKIKKMRVYEDKEEPMWEAERKYFQTVQRIIDKTRAKNNPTERYIKRYCKPNGDKVSIDNLEDILCAEVDEERLQSHLKSLPYSSFLNTLYWKTLSYRRKFMDKMQCTCCGTKKDLTVHHKTYDHHGDERHYMHDLVTLCVSCHEKEHAVNEIEKPK